MTLVASSQAIGIGLNASTPLQGFDLGSGQYATLVGVQSPTSLVGQTIALQDLQNAIISGSVSAWYYAAGNQASAMFDNITLFAPFVSDTVGAVGNRQDRIWDSLYAVHSGTVVFSNGSGGTATMSTGGTRIARDPFAPVPDAGTTMAFLGLGMAGLVALRRKLAA